jgi:RNA polymerase sigma factor for flagellar operon FliA
MVRLQAGRLASRLPPGLTIDDLISAGSEALVRVQASFDSSRGVPFEAYARKRVTWAMLDEIRSARRAKRTPSGSDEELDEVEALRASAGLSGRDSGAFSRVDDVSSEARDCIDFDTALRRLPDRERKVLKLHYRLGLTLREIADRLGISVPRVHQIKAAALRAVRRGLAA